VTVNTPLEYVALPLIPVEPISWSSHEVGRGFVVTSISTGLLLFIAGATETINGPDVAPVGIVTTMDVLLHELIVTTASFRVTTLPLCVLPKPDPEMTI